jgi:AAA15 family ATPase/GTPase
MITQLRIRNYKSILDTTIELSNLNVFIGENGCGKTNILEAVGMLSADANHNTSITTLTSKGIRVTRPTLTLSSFIDQKSLSNFYIDFSYNPLWALEKSDFTLKLKPVDKSNIFSDWVEVLEDGVSKIPFTDDQYRFLMDILEKEKNKGSLDDIDKKVDILELERKIKSNASVQSYLKGYLIFNLNTQALRGISIESREVPLGIYGEGLDVLLNDFSTEEWEILKRYTYLIDWLDDIVIDKSDKLKFEGHKLGRSNSVLYFRDKFMSKKNNVFAAENSNEGVLHILFYLALVISKKTPRFFAIDNIESSLNPKLCRVLMKILAELAIEMDKQILITTHNPAILDGLNLHEDKQRLFIVKRSDEGYTQAERIKMKPDTNGQQLKLSELWMRGYIGGLPNNF